MSIKYAYLGPAGTFTEAALQKITTPSDQLIAYANVTAALDAFIEGVPEISTLAAQVPSKKQA
jgi:prephenate dehydratase